MSSWPAWNPGWKYSCFDDDDIAAYMSKHAGLFPGLYDAFSKMPTTRTGAGRADLWRALVIYIQGGVYVDADTVLKSKRNALDSFLRPDDQGFSGVGERGDLHQQFLAYRPQHPLLLRLLERAIPAVLANPSASLEDLTGPRQMHRAAIDIIAGAQGNETFIFTPGVWWDNSGTASIRVVAGNGCGGRIKFKYGTSVASYTRDLQALGLEPWYFRRHHSF